MKLTKEDLVKIIKEELARARTLGLSPESFHRESPSAFGFKVPKNMPLYQKGGFKAGFDPAATAQEGDPTARAEYEVPGGHAKVSSQIRADRAPTARVDVPLAGGLSGYAKMSDVTKPGNIRTGLTYKQPITKDVGVSATYDPKARAGHVGIGGVFEGAPSIKLTKEDLVKIIKEELDAMLSELGFGEGKPAPDELSKKRVVYLEEDEEIEEGKKKTKVSKPGQKRVSKKIGHLVGKEGKSQEQAAAIAYSMENRGELKKGGKHTVG